MNATPSLTRGEVAAAMRRLPAGLHLLLAWLATGQLPPAR